jgi:hypothetical protein
MILQIPYCSASGRIKLMYAKASCDKPGKELQQPNLLHPHPITHPERLRHDRTSSNSTNKYTTVAF